MQPKVLVRKLITSICALKSDRVFLQCGGDQDCGTECWEPRTTPNKEGPPDSTFILIFRLRLLGMGSAFQHGGRVRGDVELDLLGAARLRLLKHVGGLQGWARAAGGTGDNAVTLGPARGCHQRGF